MAQQAAPPIAELNRQRIWIRRRDVAIALVANTLPLAGAVWIVWALLNGGAVGGFEVGLFLVGHFLTMVGLELGYHRYFAHRVFKTHRWFELLLGVLGSSSFQGGVILWTATHRRHHANTDKELDPHSPVANHITGKWIKARGLWHAHVGWMFNQRYLKPPGWERLALDMFRDPQIFSLHLNYWKWGLLGLLTPAVLGGLWYQSLLGAWLGFLWGGLLRVFVANQLMYATNSLCHTIGTRMFKRFDNSRNILPLSIVSIGLSLHNNHHAFPAAASLQFRWWQIDIAGGLIWILEKMGVVWDVRRPTAEMIAQKLTGMEIESPVSRTPE